MDIDSPDVQAYLSQLNQIAGSDPDAQVSMHEVGDALGLEHDQTAQMAEMLFISGYAELKTLSGGIGITPMGMDALGVSPVVTSVGGTVPTLSGEPVVTDQDRAHIDGLVETVKSALGSTAGEYQTLEAVVMDIKTIEVQMLSSTPKTAVIREVFKSISQALPEKDFADTVGCINAMVKV